MYITSKQESYTENDLNKFEVKQYEIKIFIKFGNINKFISNHNRNQLLIGVMNLRGYFLHYLQPNVVFLNYTVGGTMQVSFKSLNFF